MPAPNTVVLVPRPQAPVYPTPPQTSAYPIAHTQPAGWYPGPSGLMQWWDGLAWGPSAPHVARPVKDVGIAYLLLLLLGGFGAHRFHLGRTGSAVLLLCLWLGGWLLVVFLIGIPLIIAGGIWMLVDLFILASMVRQDNARRFAGS